MRRLGFTKNRLSSVTFAERVWACTSRLFRMAQSMLLEIPAQLPCRTSRVYCLRRYGLLEQFCVSHDGYALYGTANRTLIRRFFQPYGF